MNAKYNFTARWEKFLHSVPLNGGTRHHKTSLGGLEHQAAMMISSGGPSVAFFHQNERQQSCCCRCSVSSLSLPKELILAERDWQFLNHFFRCVTTNTLSYDVLLSTVTPLFRIIGFPTLYLTIFPHLLYSPSTGL